MCRQAHGDNSQDSHLEMEGKSSQISYMVRKKNEIEQIKKSLLHR